VHADEKTPPPRGERAAICGFPEPNRNAPNIVRTGPGGRPPVARTALDPSRDLELADLDVGEDPRHLHGVDRPGTEVLG
jgi:hypothetical protein